jgi:hypothetical protein
MRWCWRRRGRRGDSSDLRTKAGTMSSWAFRDSKRLVDGRGRRTAALRADSVGSQAEAVIGAGFTARSRNAFTSPRPRRAQGQRQEHHPKRNAEFPPGGPARDPLSLPEPLLPELGHATALRQESSTRRSVTSMRAPETQRGQRRGLGSRSNARGDPCERQSRGYSIMGRGFHGVHCCRLSRPGSTRTEYQPLYEKACSSVTSRYQRPICSA